MPQAKVELAVYYESLCADSLAFISGQLQPAWRQATRVELLPYGKAIHYKDAASNSTGWRFQCQHGPAECRGNKVHACILNCTEIPFGQQLALIGCLMKDYRTAFETCAAEVQLSAGAGGRVQRCAAGPEGDRLLAAAGDRTWALGFNLSFVPTLVFNGVFDQALQDEGFRDLRAVLERLSRPSPQPSPQPSPRPTNSTLS